MPSAFVFNGLLRVAALGLAGLAVPLAVLLLNAAGRDALHGPVHAQSSPSISIELSPGHSVPMDTAITGTVTLTGLDFDSYSSVIFRADITPYGDGETKCNGDDTGMDIEIPVDESREVFTVRIFDACPSAYYSYGTYTLDVSISRVETDPLGDWVELASAHTQFLMSRYLIAGEQTAPPPDPDAQAWMDPAPRTLDIYVGEWLRFQFRSDVTKYLNDHLGVLVNGSEFGLFATGGSSPPTTPSTDPEEACLRDQDSDGHWRRAIHQSLWIVACRPGDARILLTHETHAGDPLYTYEFRTLATSTATMPRISIAAGAAVTEGSDAAFTLVRSGTTTAALTVNVNVTETGSMLGASRPSTVTLDAGDSSTVLAVATDDDNVVEDASEITVVVQADTNTPPTYSVGLTGRATLTVTDNDAAAFSLSVVTLVSGLTIPWGIAFTPDGTMLFTQRPGVLSVRLTDGTIQTVTADLGDLFVNGETGLMAIVVDPAFDSNRRFYTCQVHTGREVQVIAWIIDAAYATATRADDPLVGDIPAASRHSGCRLRFGPEGYLWIATGDAAAGTVPQDLSSLGGKVLRVNASTGAGAPGNPFATSSRVYTYGHRNVQGLALRPGTSQMWAVEHGPNVDDEINLLVVGGNYGWDPVPGYNESVPMTDRVKFPQAIEAKWSSGDPTLATSGGIFLDGDWWGDWEGRLAVASLKDRSLRIFGFAADGTLVSETSVRELDGTHGRLRTPMLGPDGALYVTTSNGGGADRILKVTPKPPAFPAETDTQEVSENGAPSNIIAAVAAAYPDADTLTYTLRGPDAASFNIPDTAKGEVRANAPLDYETKRSYQVVVTATDPYGLSDSITFTINVANEDDEGAITLSSAQPRVGANLSAHLTDQDGDIRQLVWEWHTSTDQVNWAPVSGAASDSYRPVVDDLGSYLRATAYYNDGEGQGKQAESVTASQVRAASPPPPPPPPPSPPITSVGGGGGGGGGAPRQDPSVIVFSPKTLSFEAVEGGDNPPPQALRVWNGEEREMAFGTSENAAWLVRSPSAGITDGPDDPVRITLSVDVSGLEAGSYSASVRISGRRIGNSPQRVPVTLTVRSPGYARERVSQDERTEIVTPDSTVRLVVPENAAPSDVDIEVQRLDAGSQPAPPGDQERVVVAAELQTFAPGSETPRPTSYSPGAELRLLLPEGEEDSCAAGRVRVYRVSSGEWELLEHRCETGDEDRVWAVATATRLGSFLLTVDDAAYPPGSICWSVSNILSWTTSRTSESQASANTLFTWLQGVLRLWLSLSCR